jgi:chemotaxis protein histidine kinase CheA
MSRVRSFFLEEAGECISDLRRELEVEPLDAAAVHRIVRRLRGSADMARFGGLTLQARELEVWLRDEAPAMVAAGSAESVGSRVRQVLGSLERALTEIREGRQEEDPRMEDGMTQVEARAEQDGQEVVPVERLEYQGAAAIERALSLREALEDAIVADEPAGPVLDELFDLIRLGAR